ncbi:hypothetical protein Spb1_05890 [Planctopirus ephydatiae]|uniref:Uncharacterized protein n=1 Tax=Planctopirus ephydatiae TaxID=2528019 RepID=A0A518GJE8_9PLAN|nr:hypothetical protein [Planctopirus ephydatiae]QDV28724.1 hypothetical protein Spb1_05890 [Planctopirus ephydatiae]
MSFRNPEVLRYLKCARCRQGLVLRQIASAAQTNETTTEAVSSEQEFLLCTNADCRLEFSIREEIPVLVTEFARERPLDQWQTYMNDRPNVAPVSEIAPAAG